jgi:CubicO group peptidase (beta-lactamase class C family)
MARLGIVAALACSLLCTVASAQDKPDSSTAKSELHPDIARLVDTWLDAEQAYKKLPSMVVGVVKSDAIVFSKGYGSVSGKGGPLATPNTIYSICSISKLFTSIALMQLVEQGKVGLDDDIVKYIPEFTVKQTDESSGPVTLRGILMHAAGLPRETINDTWTGPEYPFPTRAEMLAGLARQQMYDRTLNRNQYSNLGFALLGEIVARVSGQPYERYVTDRVIKPLGLDRTSPSINDALRGTEMAVGFSVRKRDGSRDEMPRFDVRGAQAAAGFSSTVNDLSKFALWQLRLLRTGKADVLRAATLREMTRIQWTDPDGKTTWGLGYSVSRSGSNDLVVGHGGRCPGYRTLLTTLPQKELGAVVALGSGDDPDQLGRRTLELVQKTPTPAREKAPALGDYTGRYEPKVGGGEISVQPWGSDLVTLSLPTENPGEAMQVWRHVGGDRFRLVRQDKTLGAEATFLRDASGKVTSMRIWGSVTYKQ